MLANDICFAIQEILFRFMRSLDDKNWEELHHCLIDNIYCDYSIFRGETPGKISRDDYINKRKETLAQLKTQHNLSNLLMRSCNETAEVKCNYTIYRFHAEFAGEKTHFFHSYGQYVFELKHEKSLWKIAAITQILLMNDGNPELHAGARHAQRF